MVTIITTVAVPDKLLDGVRGARFLTAVLKTPDDVNLHSTRGQRSDAELHDLHPCKPLGRAVRLQPQQTSTT
jgi:hypothetical protein